MTSSVVLIRIRSLLIDPKVIDRIFVIDQNDTKQFYANAIRRLIRRLDQRLLLFIVLLENSSFINRVSIGHTKLMSIQIDLHMSNSQHSLVISIFYIAHFLFDVPSNLLLRFIGPTRYLALSMLVWGSIMIGMAFVTNTHQLLIARCLLGVAQAGYFSGIIIYFSLRYCKRDQIMRIAILFVAAILSRALAGVLAYSMEKMKDIGDLRSWQWLFLLEGLPIIPLGIITYLFLDSVPNAVQWLDNMEKQLLTNLLRNDAGVADQYPTSRRRLSWRQVRYVFIDWRIYFYGLIAIESEAVILGLTTFLPTLMGSMNYSKTEVYLMSAPPCAVACIVCLLVSYSSSRRNEHGYHIAFCLLIDLFGFVLMLTLFDRGKVAVYVSTTIAFCGILSAFPLLLSWLANNVGSHTKRTMAISFVIGIVQIGGIVMPLIYREIDQPIYRRGHVICSGMLAASFILTLILWNCLRRENYRRTNLSLEEYKREAAIKESCDRHPDVRYVL